MGKSLLGWKLSVPALSGKLGADWERDRRDTLFLMGSIAVCSLTHVHHLPVWVSIAFAILFFWRLGLVLSGRWLPGTAVRLIAALAAALGVYAQYRTLFGRDAGVALLVLFLGLKLMEIQAKRDLFVVIFLCMLLLLLSFLYSQSIWNAVLVLTALLTLVATLLTMQFGYHEAPVQKRFRIAAGLLGKSLPIAVVLFLLFPRIDQPLWKLPNDSAQGRTGLSDRMAPGSIAQLNESDEIAFRVRFEGQAPAQRQLYWRGPVLGQFDGRQWSPVQYEIGMPPAPQLQMPANPQQVTYTVTMEPQVRNFVLALEHPTALPMIGARSAQIQPDLQVIHSDSLDNRVRYSATSMLNSKAGLNESQLSLQNWLSLPAGFNPKTLQLALDWRNEETNNKKLVERALQLFNKDQFFYTLSPPLYGKHVVDEFLFEKKRGFCEHYSQAFVVLMRALDIPARVVTGYQGGEMNPVDGYLAVRQKDAHAWTEVWLENEGWVRIDPTAAIAPERVTRPQRSENRQSNVSNSENTSDWLTRARFQLDAITNGWNQWMLNYDRQKQRSLMQALGLDADDWQQLVGLLAVLLGVILALVALFTLRPKKRPDPVEKTFLDAVNQLERLGIERAKNETAITLANRVQNSAPLIAKRFYEIVQLYNQLRYGQNQVSSEELARLKRLVRGLNSSS